MIVDPTNPRPTPPVHPAVAALGAAIGHAASLVKASLTPQEHIQAQALIGARSMADAISSGAIDPIAGHSVYPHVTPPAPVALPGFTPPTVDPSLLGQTQGTYVTPTMRQQEMNAAAGAPGLDPGIATKIRSDFHQNMIHYANSEMAKIAEIAHTRPDLLPADVQEALKLDPVAGWAQASASLVAASKAAGFADPRTYMIYALRQARAARAAGAAHTAQAQ